MKLARLARGLIGLYAVCWVLRACPGFLFIGQGALRALRERDPAPFLEMLKASHLSVGGLAMVLVLALFAARWSALLAWRLPEPASLDGLPLLRAAQAVVGAALVLAAVPAAAETLCSGIRPVPFKYQLPAEAAVELATVALGLTAGLVLFVGARNLARCLARLTRQRPGL